MTTLLKAKFDAAVFKTALKPVTGVHRCKLTPSSAAPDSTKSVPMGLAVLDRADGIVCLWSTEFSFAIVVVVVNVFGSFIACDIGCGLQLEAIAALALSSSCTFSLRR